jgi:hypothetical protein
MAQYNSTQFALVSATPPTSVRPDEVAGRVRTLYAKYTTDASAGLTTSDVLVIGKLPANARVISAEAFVPASFLSSSSKIGYGTLSGSTYTAVDDDRWGTGIDLSSAGRKQYLTLVGDLDYRTTAEFAVALTIITTTTGLGLVIEFVIQYVVD